VSTTSAMTVQDVAAGLAVDDRKKRTETMGWVTAQMKLAERGDEKALAIVKDLYKELPHLWPKANLLQRNAELDLINLMTNGGKQLHSKLVIEHQLNQMRADLAGPDATPLEQLLVDRVVVCWLDCMYADLLKVKRLTGHHSVSEGEYFSRRAEQAQRQFLKAVRALAMVRRLRVPAIQVNLANQQVNVAG
jgi:hypothetical protein